MNVLYPKFRLHLLPAMLGYAMLGAVLAGFYGLLHDQITYSISPEYFTRLKFVQFHYADLGLPARLFVAEIGFLAASWVGFIAGWFLARLAVPKSSPALARSCIVRGFALILSSAAAGSILGFALGAWRGPNADYSGWQALATRCGVADLSSFVHVAYIHNSSYLAAFIGLVVALIYVRRVTQRTTQFPP